MISVAVNISFFVYVLKKWRVYKIAFDKIGGFLLYNAIQLIFTIAMLADSKHMETEAVFLGLCIPIILITVIAIPFKNLFDDIVEKESVDESYEFLLRKMETNQKFYIMMREYEEQLATLRHDFMNQIQVAYAVIEHSENKAEGTALLHALNEKINQTRVPALCNHKGVNIVLAMKHKELEQLGIRIDIDMKISEKIRIDESDVSFLIMNMLEEMVELFELVNTEWSTEHMDQTATRNISLSIKNKENQIIIGVKYPKLSIQKTELEKKLKSNYLKYYEKTTMKYNGTVFYEDTEEASFLIARLENKNLEEE